MYKRQVYLPLGYKTQPNTCTGRDSIGRVIECLNPAKEITQDNRKKCKEYVNETGFVLKSC